MSSEKSDDNEDFSVKHNADFDLKPLNFDQSTSYDFSYPPYGTDHIHFRFAFPLTVSIEEDYTPSKKLQEITYLNQDTMQSKLISEIKELKLLNK